MTAHPEALVKSTSAMLEQSGDVVRNCRLKETIVFSWRKLRPFKERYNFVQYAAIAAAVDILGGGVSQPRAIIRNSGSHALPRMGKPPMLNVAFNELPRRCA